jgi:ABC-type sugar transport system permease subunit
LFIRDGRYALAAAYGIVIFFVIASLTIANATVTRSFREEP